VEAIDVQDDKTKIEAATIVQDVATLRILAARKRVAAADRKFTTYARKNPVSHA
jgi:hypothetical protein